MAETEALNIPKSYANNFWGAGDGGYNAMFKRQEDASKTCEELRAFYKERIAIEEEYAKRMAKLSKFQLGSVEYGWMGESLQAILTETESVSKSRREMAAQMKSQLEDALTSFAMQQKEKRRPVQVGIERLHKTKVSQEQQLEKIKEKYESDCVKITGYIAQSNMLLGKELEKNNAKLEKAQISVQSSNRDYQGAVRVLHDTAQRWVHEWRSACDKFQELDEDRIDFMKANIWNYANLYSAICVSEDDSCEKIRLALENIEVEKDIGAFIDASGTGHDIPEPPKYKNFNAQKPESDADETEYGSGINKNGAAFSPVPSQGLDDGESNVSSGRPVSPYVSESRLSNRASFDRSMDQSSTRHLHRSSMLRDQHDMSPSPAPSSIYSHNTASDAGPEFFKRQGPSQADSGDEISAFGKPFPDPNRHSMASSNSNSNSVNSQYMLGIGGNMLPVRDNKAVPASSDDPITNALAKLDVSMSSPNTTPRRRQDFDTAQGVGIQTPTGRSPQRGANELDVPRSAHNSVDMRQTKDFYTQRTNMMLGDGLSQAALQESKAANDGAHNRQRSADGRVNAETNSPRGMAAESSPRAMGADPRVAYTRPQQSFPPIPMVNGSPQSNKIMKGEHAGPGARSYDPQQQQQQLASPTGSARSSGGTRYAPMNNVGSPSRRGMEGQMSSTSPARYGMEGMNANTSPSRRGMEGQMMYQQASPVAGRQNRSSRGPATSPERESPRHARTSASSRHAPPAEPVQYTSDGLEILGYVRALYDYQAAIPEEIGFQRGDTLMVLRTQEDGWWEGEVVGAKRGRRGLFPSNFVAT